MSNKTKPIYLIIAGILLIGVVLIFIVLIIQAHNTATRNSTATMSERAPGHTMTVSYTYPTTETSIIVKTTVKDIINDKGFYLDKSGKVYDKNNVEYSVKDEMIGIVYNGCVYKISKSQIKEVNPQIRDNKAQTETKAETQPNNSNVNDNTSERTPDSNTNDSSGKEDGQNTSITVTQQNNVTKIEGNAPSPNNIKMSYKSLSVTTDTIFSLVLIGATNSVSWSIEDENLVKIYQNNGNQCSFTTVSKGTTRVIATYDNHNYYCTINIS